MNKKTVLVTGSNGFLGKNLIIKLKELNSYTVLEFTRANTLTELKTFLKKADYLYHLAAVNRPENDEKFNEVNVNLTKYIVDIIKKEKLNVQIVFASSSQAISNSPYGISKKKAEDILIELHETNNNMLAIFRLPGVFGKWSLPNYNSVVATFCYNLSRNIEIDIHEPDKLLEIVYIDDVIKNFLVLIDKDYRDKKTIFYRILETYSICIRDLADRIKSFEQMRTTLLTQNVGSGLGRALYATYVSFLPQEKFYYSLESNVDERGNFVEFIKTLNSGQISFFTSKPGKIRGGHYHHTKSEKFLVLKGQAKFRFKNIISNDYFDVDSSDSNPVVVETIPGWAHDITNVGSEDMIVMLWANENFDESKPDTYKYNLNE